VAGNTVKYMNKFTFVCPCGFGLESVLNFEVKRIGGENIRTENGRLMFDGDDTVLAKANLNLRTAERVLILLGEFNATSFEELFQGVKAIDFSRYIREDDSFPVKGWSINSQLKSVPDCQKIIKKAIVENLKEKYNISWFSEDGITTPIQFSILKDKVAIMLDTSGDGLHKRGYRKTPSKAPIKETLAAGIVDLAMVKRDSLVYDPMCGSGTILIEAGLKAFNIAPGINRNFISEKFSFLDENVFKLAREEAMDNVYKDAKFKAFGFDIDEEVLEICRQNIKKVGLNKKIVVENCDLSKFHPKIKDATVITNPPYGERMFDINEAKRLYKTLGHIKRNYENLSMYTISPEEQFETFFGKRSDKRRKLYNGMIKCNLYMYYK